MQFTGIALWQLYTLWRYFVQTHQTWMGIYQYYFQQDGGYPEDHH